MAPILNDEEMLIDPFELLGVTFDSTELDAQKAYRKASLKCHPDRNPNNPDAAAKFHLISLALSILTDPSKRSYLNSRLSDARAKAERTAAMDGKRKVMVEALHAREEEAQRVKEQRKAAGLRAGEEEKIKEQGKRMRERMAQEQVEAVERESKRAKREEHKGIETGNAPTRKTSPMETDPQPAIDPLDLTLSLQCPPIEPPSSPPPYLTSSSALQTHLSNAYGPIAHVLLKAGSSSTPAGPTGPPPPLKKRKAKGPAAVIEFAPGNWSGCWACWKDNGGSSPGTGTSAKTSSRVIVDGAVLRWAGGEEPAWVGWAERRHAIRTSPATAPPKAAAATTTTTAPLSGSAEDEKAPRDPPPLTAPGASSFPATFPSTFPSSRSGKPSTTTTKPGRNAYEEDTLFKMRQAEWKRNEERRELEEMIRMEDERDV